MKIIHQTMRFLKKRTPNMVTCLAAILTTLGSFETLHSQERTKAAKAEIAKRVPVTIALTQGKALDAENTVILRRAKYAPYDVILLSETSDSMAVAKALFTLLVARQVGGDIASTDAVIRTDNAKVPDDWMKSNIAYVGGITRRLRLASAKEIAGVGTRTSYEVFLLPSSKNEKLSKSMRKEKKPS